MDNLVEIIACELDVLWIGTQTKYVSNSKNKKFIKIIGKNCNKGEKIKRINRFYKRKKIEIHTAYGNSRGDLELLSNAKYSFYKVF